MAPEDTQKRIAALVRLEKIVCRVRAAVRTRWHFARTSAREARPFCIWICGAAAVLLLSYIGYWSNAVSTTEAQIRLAGMLFQIAGLLVVVIGLNASRRLFDQPSIWRWTWQWLSRLSYIVVPPKPTKGSIISLAGAGEINVAGQAVVVMTSGTMETRVTRLEQELRRVEKTVAEVRQSIKEAEGVMRDRIGQEAVERRSGDEKVGKQLEAAVIGGIHLEFGGLAYLFLGIICTSLPEELARALPF